MALWKPKRIPRTTYPAKRRVQTLNAYNVPTTTSVDFVVENAGRPQPWKPEEMVPLPIGVRVEDVRTIFTTTPLRATVEGTDEVADEINIDGVWYTVIAVRNWSYGLQSHYQVDVAKKTYDARA